MKRSLLCLCLFVDIVYRVAADEWHCQDCRHIDAIKARILNQLGLPTSAYASYDIVWPIKPSRIKRTFSDDPFYPEPEHLMSIRIFGQRLTSHLKLSNITSSSVLPSPQCFFRGSVETCEKGQCSTGKAAVSDCSDTGLFGYFQVNDEGFALSPLPSSIAFSMREASGAHLAKLIEPLEMWDDLHENHIYVRETFPMNRVNNYLLPNFEYSPLLRTFVLPFPSTYTTPDIELNSTDTGKISVTLRIFVDKFMVNILSKKYGNDASEKLTSVLSAINAVQAIYDDTSLGPVQVLLSVTEVIFDRSPEAQGMELGDGDAEKYLVAFCDGQDSILTAEADVTVALTGLDLYGLLNNINKDKVYSSLVFRSNRIYGVTGRKYSVNRQTAIQSTSSQENKIIRPLKIENSETPKPRLPN